MAVTSTPIYPQILATAGLSIPSASAATPQTIFTAGANGSKIEWVNIATSDTSANTITINLYNGTTYYPLTVISVPAGSGNTSSVVPFNLFANSQFPGLSYDSNGNKYMYLGATWSLTCNVAAITSTKVVTVTAQAESF